MNQVSIENLPESKKKKKKKNIIANKVHKRWNKIKITRIHKIELSNYKQYKIPSPLQISAIIFPQSENFTE